jgi:hypothetical protein
MARVFDPHARDQMAARGIPDVAVYHVIGDYDRRLDGDDGQTEYFGMWDRRDLLVVVVWFDEDAGDGLVITAIDRAGRRGRRR